MCFCIRRTPNRGVYKDELGVAEYLGATEGIRGVSQPTNWNCTKLSCGVVHPGTVISNDSPVNVLTLPEEIRIELPTVLQSPCTQLLSTHEFPLPQTGGEDTRVGCALRLGTKRHIEQGPRKQWHPRYHDQMVMCLHSTQSPSKQTICSRNVRNVSFINTI